MKAREIKYIATVICFILLAVKSSLGQSNNTAQYKVIPLGITDEVTSSVLSETRKLNIYLPDGYKGTDTTRYPVIYLLDGGIDEDFIHVVGLVQFNTQEWVNRIPKSIVVGIVNVDRKRDMTYPTSVKSDKEKYPTTGGSERFISFIEKELQPYIQEHYKTNNSRTIIGESLAGLLATEILLQKPNLFNRYVIISPSLWWDNGSILENQMAITASYPANDICIYLGVGKEGLAPSIQPHVMEVDANVLIEKIKDAKNNHVHIRFDYLPEENHATISHQALLNAFKNLCTTCDTK
ncbi:MAG: alpha/beta hydrolase [Taibaiella sp.]|nr:alpha/beta hydrolase [Taibaiella sp.]